VSIIKNRSYFTNQALVKVYDKPIVNKERKKIATLLFGEWIRTVEKIENEWKVDFRGGKGGYIKTDEFDENRKIEIYFIDVGQGDSILIQTQSDKRVLIDGGPDSSANNFITWKYNLRNPKNEIDFDTIIMTHADRDHAKGLVNILNNPRIKVKAFYHNGIARFQGQKIGEKDPTKDELIEIYDNYEKLDEHNPPLSADFKSLKNAIENARKRNPQLIVKHLDQFSETIFGFTNKTDIIIEVLGPINVGTKIQPRYKYLGDPGQTLNGNSVSLLLTYKKCKILLCGDMNRKFEKEFLEYHKAKNLNAHIFKANHHGSQDFSLEFLKAVSPSITVVSSGDQPDYGHPRGILLGSLGKCAPMRVERPIVFCTEVAATYKQIKIKQLEEESKKKIPNVYEKAIYGLINVRSDGEKIFTGRVYAGKKSTSNIRRKFWEWELYEFVIDNDALILKE